MPHTSSPPSTDDLLAVLHAYLRQSAEELHESQSGGKDLPVRHRRLINALTALYSDDRALERVAERSCIHPNGFAKIVLWPVEGGGSIRLHVWSRRDGRWIQDSEPHGHRWEFVSWILAGTVRETTFAEAAEGRPYKRLFYSHRHGQPQWEQAGEASLSRVQVTDRPFGTAYQRSTSVVHTADPRGERLVASLVLQGSRNFEKTPVYQDQTRPVDHTQTPLSPQSLRNLVSDVVAAIPA